MFGHGSHVQVCGTKPGSDFQFRVLFATRTEARLFRPCITEAILLFVCCSAQLTCGVVLARHTVPGLSIVVGDFWKRDFGGRAAA